MHGVSWVKSVNLAANGCVLTTGRRPRPQDVEEADGASGRKMSGCRHPFAAPGATKRDNGARPRSASSTNLHLQTVILGSSVLTRCEWTFAVCTTSPAHHLLVLAAESEQRAHRPRRKHTA